MEHAAEERQVVLLCGEEVLVEERERDLVAGAVDDDVGLLRGPVGEADAVAFEALDVRLRRDLAVVQAAEDLARDGRVRLADAVVGLR